MNKKDAIITGVIVSIVGSIITLFFLTPLSDLIFKKDNKVTEDTKMDTVIIKPYSLDRDIIVNKPKPNYTKKENTNEYADLRSFINTFVTKENGKTNIAITVIDESGNFNASISTSIADIYNQNGNKAIVGLLKVSFIHDHRFQEMIEGNSEILEKLNLQEYTDYIAIGEIQYSFKDGTLVNGTFVCIASIRMNIFSASQKSLIKSFEISENANGTSKEQSRKIAVEKVLNRFSTDYNTI
jgi:hypothetical protein